MGFLLNFQLNSQFIKCFLKFFKGSSRENISLKFAFNSSLFESILRCASHYEGRDEKIMVKKKRNKSNLINNGRTLNVECKNGGRCIKGLRTMGDMNCTGCEKNINQES